MTQRRSGFIKQKAAGILTAGLLIAVWPAAGAPLIRSGAEPDYPPLSFIDENGAASGFSVELLREALRAVGREVSFETAPWAELKQKLADGGLDVLPLVGRTPEREVLYDFTVPYLTLHGALFVHQDETAIQSLADLRGKTIAVMQGDNAEEYVLRANLSENVVSTSTFEEAFEMLSRGEVDAVIAQKLMGVTLLKDLGITNVRVTGRPAEEFRQNFCFAVQKGNDVLLALLNEGLAMTVQSGEKQRLARQWLGTSFYAAALVRPLIYGGDRAFPPYEYLDEKGRPAGFNIDLARALARELGVEIYFRLETWSRIRRMMDTGEVDLAAMFYSEERDRTVDFSTPLSAAAQTVFARGDSPVYTGLESLRGRRISVQDGDLVHDYLLENGFTDELTVTQTHQDTLHLLADGKVDFSLGTLLQGAYWIERNNWRNLRAVESSLFVTDYCFAVPTGNTALLGRINEGLTLLKESGEYRTVYNRWMGAFDENLHRKKLRRVLLIIGSVSALIAVGALSFFHFLRRQVRKTTAELRAANNELAEARAEAFKRMEEAVLASEKLELTQFSLDHAADPVFWIKRDGSFIYVNQAACRTLGYTREELLNRSVLDIDPGMTRESWSSLWEEVQRKKRIRLETQHRTRDGHIFPVEIHSNTVLFQGKEYHFAFAHDITNRKEQQQALEAANRSLEENNRDLQAASQTALNMMQDAVQAKEELEKSEKRYRRLAEKSPAVVLQFHMACDGRFSFPFITESVQETLGVPADDVMRDAEVFLNMIDPQQREAFHEAVLESARDLSPYEQELRVLRKDGAGWLHALATPERQADGGVLWDGFFSDITLRKQAEDILHRITDEQNLILNSSSFGIALVRNRIFEWVNGRLAEIVNRPIEELEGQSTRIIYPSEADYQAIGEAYELLGRGERYDHAVQFARADGSQFWCRLTGSAIDPENPQDGSIWMFEDITDRKQAEDKLLRLSTAIEQSTDTVLITDADGIIEYVNPAFEQISGYSAAEAIGQNPRILKSGKQDARFYADLWKTLRAGKTWSGHFINQRKDGELYTEEASISPVCSTAGVITGFVAIKRDITAELEREEMFRQSQKMDSVGQLAGGIAHDFNNMLQAILGFSELLLEDLPDASPNHGNVKEIKKAAKRAAELTRKLLTFSRKQPVDQKKIDLNETVRDSEVLLHTLLGESIRLNIQLADDLRPIYSDHGQMTQVIMNLAVNARDAMPSGGRLTVATDNVILSKEDVAALPDVAAGAFVCLSVTDTGSGMSQQVQDHLFEPFFTTKEVGKGTGLGLAVLYGIVKQNKGWIHVYSEEGHGTSMKVYLPALSDQQAASSGGIPSIPNRERILLVEDDPEALKVVVRILKTADYEVTAVASAEDALACYTEASGAFDLLFSDMILPGKNGVALADELRKKNPRLPVLLYSGYRDPRERWESMSRKGYLFLQKPFTFATLLHAVHEALGTVQPE